MDMVTLLLALQLSLPNRDATPAMVRPLPIAAICTTKWGLDKRHVTLAMKRAVARRAGIPESDWSRYVFDHIVPRQLAGADDVANLQLQLKAVAKRKDVDETRLHRAVCAGQVSLGAAQREMVRWRPR